MTSTLSVTTPPLSAPILRARLEAADKLEKQLAGSIPWYEFETPQAYRDARKNGLHGFVKPAISERARTMNIQGRDGHDIEFRIISPSSGNSKGVWVHFHAGQYSMPLCS